MTPAIKGVKQAHEARLVLRRTRLDDGADDDLNETSADGKDANGNEKPPEGRHDRRQNGKQDKPRRRKDMREQNAFAVADDGHEARGTDVGQQLDKEIDGDERGKLYERNAVAFLKGKK